MVEQAAPTSPPHGWMTIQAQLPYFPSMTPGLTGEQSSNGWLSVIRKVVRRVVCSFPRPLTVAVPPLLRAIEWVLRYASVHRGRES